MLVSHQKRRSRNEKRIIPANREKKETPQSEPPCEPINESESEFAEASATPNTRPTAETEYASELTPISAPAQAVTDLRPGIWFM